MLGAWLLNLLGGPLRAEPVATFKPRGCNHSTMPASRSIVCADAAQAGRDHAAAQPVRMLTVDAEQGQRLDNFLLGRLKGVPRSRVYRMVRRGEVRVNGARARPSARLARGDQVRVPPLRAGAAGEAQALAPAALFESLLANAVYQDRDLLVLDKPSGVAAHGGSGVSFGVVETLRQFDPGVGYALAHRLDRDTSGCLAVARNRKALLALNEQFRRGRVGKRYDLLVAGRWPRRLRRVDEPLERFVLGNGERRVRVSSNGDAARTDFSILGRFEDFTWLAAHPKTGRTHQIRVHAAAAGHPILGDDKYAPRQARRTRLMLHASRLSLTLNGRAMRFSAPLPAEFRRALPED